MSNLRNNDWTGWEIDPSTRTSTHPFTKYYSFRDADVANDAVTTIFTVDRGVPAVNLVLNPNIEIDSLAEFVASGSGVTQSSAQKSDGTYSLLVNPADSAAGEGFYWVTPNLAGAGHNGINYLVARCKVRGHSASGDCEIVVRNSSGTDVATGDNISLSESFQDLTVKYKLPAAAATYQVMVRTKTQHDINFYVDQIHVEHRVGDSTIPAYVDGNQGINYEWDGTANASVSRRRAGLSVIRGMRLRNESTTVLDIVYVGLDLDDSTTAAQLKTRGIPVAGGDIFEPQWPIDFRSSVKIIAQQNTPAFHGVIWGIHQG